MHVQPTIYPSPSWVKFWFWPLTLDHDFHDKLWQKSYAVILFSKLLGTKLLTAFPLDGSLWDFTRRKLGLEKVDKIFSTLNFFYSVSYRFRVDQKLCGQSKKTCPPLAPNINLVPLIVINIWYQTQKSIFHMYKKIFFTIWRHIVIEHGT